MSTRGGIFNLDDFFAKFPKKGDFKFGTRKRKFISGGTYQPSAAPKIEAKPVVASPAPMPPRAPVLQPQQPRKVAAPTVKKMSYSGFYDVQNHVEGEGVKYIQIDSTEQLKSVQDELAQGKYSDCKKVILKVGDSEVLVKSNK